MNEIAHQALSEAREAHPRIYLLRNRKTRCPEMKRTAVLQMD
jgi:hypothetical protein